MLDAPVILFCSERSGSNLIAKIFDAHPQVCAPGASHLFKVMSECACKYRPGSMELRRAVLDLFDAKVSHWTIDGWPAPERSALLADLHSAGAMAAALYASEARAAGKSFVFIKENSAFGYLHFINNQCKDPRYLFMVRDPRDMALSWVGGPVMRGGVLRATARWVYDQEGYLSVLPDLPDGTAASFLRYEDLLADPEAQMRRVCGELRLDYSPDMVRFHVQSTSAQADARRSSMWSNLDKPLIADNSNKFPSGLSDDEIAYIEAVAGRLMGVLGYAPSREGKAAYGAFETLDELRAHLARSEPHEKAAYQELDAEERGRFERWARLYANMSALPPLAPAQLLGAGE